VNENITAHSLIILGLPSTCIDFLPIFCVLLIIFTISTFYELQNNGIRNDKYDFFYCLFAGGRVYTTTTECAERSLGWTIFADMQSAAEQVIVKNGNFYVCDKYRHFIKFYRATLTRMCIYVTQKASVAVSPNCFWKIRDLSRLQAVMYTV